MALLSEIKTRMFAAMKAGKTVEKEILRVAVGEITTAAARVEAGELSDDEIQAVLKKLVKSNTEALAQATDPETQAALKEEITILHDFLPKTLSVEEIKTVLAGVADAIRQAPNQGPAMGIAMKALKATGKNAEAKDVAAAVGAIRG